MGEVACDRLLADWTAKAVWSARCCRAVPWRSPAHYFGSRVGGGVPAIGEVHAGPFSSAHVVSLLPTLVFFRIFAGRFPEGIAPVVPSGCKLKVWRLLRRASAFQRPRCSLPSGPSYMEASHRELRRMRVGSMARAGRLEPVLTHTSSSSIKVA